MNAKTVVLGSFFYVQLCTAIQRDELRETRGIINVLPKVLKRFNFETKIEDIERIIIVMHQSLPTRSLRKMTEEQRKDHPPSNMSNESTFNVENGHYYFVDCSLLPSPTGELKLKEYDSSNTLGADRLKIVSENLEKYLSFLFKTCFSNCTNHDALGTCSCRECQMLSTRQLVRLWCICTNESFRRCSW